MADFEAHRDALFGAAYRILGSCADAEDVLQEAWLRCEHVDWTTVADPRAYLFRVVSRLAVDQLRQRKARRETYVGPWLPEPLLSDPESDTEMAESVSMAMLVVLESLDPVERAVFVLHEVFGFDHAEIAPMIGRTERATRQLSYRARRHVHARRDRHRPSLGEHREITERFLAAAVGGDMTALTNLLAPDVAFWADADGRSETPREPVLGRAAVSAYLCSVTWAWPSALEMRAGRINAGPGAVVTSHGKPYMVFCLDIGEDDKMIHVLRLVLNRDKLAHIR
jgi:RNA polymerase sigma-70 factor, ECF subfamily